MFDKYETVIGLEIHVQLGTKSKAFCSDATTFGSAPNTQVSTISLAHPGTLPRMNKKQMEYAIKLGLALDCEINPRNTFDRKNYFYADLPKGYQITQDQNPICLGGTIEIDVAGKTKKIRLHHIHMEEDAGKSIHELDPKNTLIDLNRAGVPLLEIVTEPDLRSPEEVEAVMNTVRQLVRYLDISDGNMEEGSMRCDCNVSVRLHGAAQYGERCEIKNMNSMRFAKKAINYEVKRQIKILEKGGKIDQQTLNFNPDTGITTPLRSKEDAHDYRYFPEPDLPPIVITPAYIDEIKANMPPLPKQLHAQFMKAHQLSTYDADLLTEDKQVALYYLDFTKACKAYKAVANLIINKLRPYVQEEGIAISDFPVSIKTLSGFIQLINEGKVSNAIAYQRILPALIENPNKTALEIAEQLNLVQNSDENYLLQIVDEVIAKNPEKLSAYRKGKKGLLGFFMGEIMRASKGKADPKATNSLLQEKLK